MCSHLIVFTFIQTIFIQLNCCCDPKCVRVLLLVQLENVPKQRTFNKNKKHKWTNRVSKLKNASKQIPLQLWIFHQKFHFDNELFITHGIKAISFFASHKRTNRFQISTCRSIADLTPQFNSSSSIYYCHRETSS